jgi:hypothetical protein
VQHFSQPQQDSIMDYSAMFTAWSKMYRDLYSKAHDTLVEEWIKAEQNLADNTKIVWWKK